MNPPHDTTPGNLTKVCALSIPCGVDVNAIPAGLMLMQHPHQEGAPLRVVKTVKTALECVESQ